MIRSLAHLGCLALWLAPLGCGHSFETSVPDASGAGGSAGAGGAGAGGAGSVSSAVSVSSSISSTSTASGTGGAGGEEPTPSFAHTVFVTDKQGNGLESIPVVVYDAHNGHVSSVYTPAGGMVSVDVPEGGAVSVAYVVNQSLNLETFLALPNGGDLVVKTDIDSTPPPAVYPVTTYNIVALGAPVGTKSYTYYSTCDSAVSPVNDQKLYNTGCTDLGEQNFMVVALDASGKGLAWGTLSNVSTAPGATVAYGITLSHLDFASFDLAIKNPPAGATGSLEIEPATILAVTPSFYTYATPVVGELHLAGSWPASLGLEVDITEQVGEIVFNGSRLYSRTRKHTLPPAVDTFSSDVWAAVTVSPLDLSDPATPVLSWQLGAGSVGDIGVAELTWISGAASGRQRVSFPANYATSIQLPPLAPEIGGWAKPLDVAYAYTKVTYTDHDAATDYADVLDGVSPGLGQGTTLTSCLYYESPAP